MHPTSLQRHHVAAAIFSLFATLTPVAFAADDPAPAVAAARASTAASGELGGAVVQSVVGDWTITFDWDCDGLNKGVNAWHIKADGTFTDDSFHTGTWVQNGKYFRMTYPNNYYYDGRMKKNVAAVGNIFNFGDNVGCWKAKRVSP